MLLSAEENSLSEIWCCRSSCIFNFSALLSFKYISAVSWPFLITWRKHRQDVCNTILVGQSPSWERIIPVRLRQSQPSLPICTSKTIRISEIDLSKISNCIWLSADILYCLFPLWNLSITSVPRPYSATIRDTCGYTVSSNFSIVPQ